MNQDIPALRFANFKNQWQETTSRTKYEFIEIVGSTATTRFVIDSKISNNGISAKRS